MVCPHCAFPNEPKARVCIKCKRSVEAFAIDAASKARPAEGGAAFSAKTDWMKAAHPPPGKTRGSASQPPSGTAAADPVAVAKETLEQARRLVAEGDLRGAFICCQSILIERFEEVPEPLLAEIYLAMGQVSISQDKLSRARKYLDKAVALQPDLSGLRGAQEKLDALMATASNSTGEEAGSESPPRASARRPAQTDRRKTPNPPAIQRAPSTPSATPRPASTAPNVEQPPPSKPIPTRRTEAKARPGRVVWSASFWARALAFGLDALLVAVLLAIMIAVAAVGLGYDSDALVSVLAGGFGNLTVFGLTYCVLLIIYSALFSRVGGQTLGKMRLNLRVVRLDGHSLTTRLAVRRALGMLLAGLPGLAGFLWAAVDLERRGWHDRIGGTLVICIQPPPSVIDAASATDAPARGLNPR